jgi:hypothetical protein
MHIRENMPKIKAVIEIVKRTLPFLSSLNTVVKENKSTRRADIPRKELDRNL